MKKMRRIICSLLVALMMLCTGFTAFAEVDTESKYGITEEDILEATIAYYEQVSEMTDAELEQSLVTYASDPVGSSYFKSWMDVKAQLDTFVQTMDDSLSITMTDTGFEAVLPIKYENQTVNLTLIFDETEGVNSVTFEIPEDMSLGTIFKKAGLNTILGMGTVFAVLILISFLIYLLGVICGAKPKKTAEPKAVAASQPAKAPDKEEELVVAMAASVAAQADDTELVAVISAAIAASTGMSTDDFVVRSIRKVKRSR